MISPTPPARSIVSNTDEGFENIDLCNYATLLKNKYHVGNKILLIQIPQFNFQYFNPDAVRNKGYYAYPPTGLQYLVSALEGRGLNIKILDLNYELLKRFFEDNSFDYKNWLSILDECLDTFHPSIIGVSCMFDTGINAMINLLNHLKKKDQSIVLAGGVVATYEWKALLEREICHLSLKVNQRTNSIIFWII